MSTQKKFFWKVIPEQRTDIVGAAFTVVGILAFINQNIPIDLTTKVKRGFFINFLLSDGKEKGEINTETDAFVEKMMAANLTQEQADAAIYNIVKALEGFGTVEEKYEAAGMLAAQYGYALAPLSEQNGDPLYVEPVPAPEPEPEPPTQEPPAQEPPVNENPITENPEVP